MNVLTQRSFVKYLGDQPLLKIVRGLLLSPAPRHLREIANRYSLSPSGVSDIIKRLDKLGMIKETLQKNRRCFSLILTDKEKVTLNNFFLDYEINFIEERSRLFNKQVLDKFKWIDDTRIFYKSLKQKIR